MRTAWRWLHQLLCPHIHEVRERAEGRLRLRCWDCHRVTVGWPWPVAESPRPRAVKARVKLRRIA